jgi:hypothetical protein
MITDFASPTLVGKMGSQSDAPLNVVVSPTMVGKMGNQSDAALNVFVSPIPVGKTGSQSQCFVAVFESSIPGPVRLLTLDLHEKAASEEPPVKCLLPNLPRRLVYLSQRILRRILAAKESLFKFGTFVPRTDKEADKSPEADRWRAGRALEWFRLNQTGTFDGDWTWDKVRVSYPAYKRSEVSVSFSMCTISSSQGLRETGICLQSAGRSLEAGSGNG